MNNTAPSLALYVLNHFTEPTLAQEKPYSRRGLGKRGGKREGGAEREAAREEEVIGLQRNLPQRAASGVVPVKEVGLQAMDGRDGRTLTSIMILAGYRYHAKRCSVGD